MNRTELARNGPGTELANVAPMPEELEAISAALSTLKALRTFVKSEFVEGIDMGKIPGTDKPTLLQAGAQKASMYFDCTPRYQTERLELGNGHLEIVSICQLRTRASDKVVAEGIGSCSTMEKKYRWRGGERTCPECGSAQIRKSKQDDGFYCWAKMGGCGATFRKNDPRITGQTIGRVPNEDIYDLRNTVLKMANKRSLVAAAMNLGCLSEFFTQDVEDIYDMGEVQAARRAEPAPEPSQPTPKVYPTDVPVPGCDGPYDQRSYQALVIDATKDHNTRLIAAEAGHKGSVPLLKSQEVHVFMMKRAVEHGKYVGSLPASANKAIPPLTDVYTKHRDWLRTELNGFLSRRLEAAREAVVEPPAEPTPAPEVPDDDAGDPPGDYPDDGMMPEPGSNG